MNAEPLRVRSHTTERVFVLETDGPLDEDVVKDLILAIEHALAELPRAVVCDLSSVVDAEPDAVEQIASAGRHVHQWPGVPVAVACPDTQLREKLSVTALGRHLLLAASRQAALAALAEAAAALTATTSLPPHPTAAHDAREFITHTLAAWQLGTANDTACLVATELVTNAMLHAGTTIELSVAAHQQDVRLTVRDHSPNLPLHRGTDHFENSGRGLLIVGVLSRAWGVLPARDGGKVVWAVLDTAA